TVAPNGIQFSFERPARRSRNGAGYGGWPSIKSASPPSGSLIVRGACSRSVAGMRGVHRSGRTSRCPSLDRSGGSTIVRAMVPQAVIFDYGGVLRNDGRDVWTAADASAGLRAGSLWAA